MVADIYNPWNLDDQGSHSKGKYLSCSRVLCCCPGYSVTTCPLYLSNHRQSLPILGWQSQTSARFGQKSRQAAPRAGCKEPYPHECSAL